MTTFEVTVESARGAPLRLLVAADNWVGAWQDGLRALGVDELPADAACSVGADGVVDVDIPTLGRRFVVKPIADHQGPRPRPGQPLVLEADGQPADGDRRALGATKNPKLFRRPAPGRGRDDGLPTDVSEALTPLPFLLAPRTTPDPIARVLSELERQRLLSRPVRISSETGLPTHELRAPLRRDPTPNGVPRPQPTTDERRRPRDATLGELEAAPTDQLPQQFRPVHTDEVPDGYDLALQWAADTAWHHVPCALALVLSSDDAGHAADVVAARGEHEREARGCIVPCDDASLPLVQLARAPSLARYPTERALRFERHDDTSWELPVGSVLQAPVALPDGELTGLGLVLVNASRPGGFTDSELRAVTYLARTLATRL